MKTPELDITLLNKYFEKTEAKNKINLLDETNLGIFRTFDQGD